MKGTVDDEPLFGLERQVGIPRLQGAGISARGQPVQVSKRAVRLAAQT